MTPSDSTQGARAAYNFWLGLIPQFLAQFGGAAPAAAENTSVGKERAFPSLEGLMFPADQIAKAAKLTQQSLEAMAQSLAPMLQGGGVANLLAQWANASAVTALGKPGEAGTAAQALLGPWAALMSNAANAIPTLKPQGSQPSAYSWVEAPISSLQAVTQAWADAGAQLAKAAPAQLNTVFHRTYGALSDALGLGPVRELQAAWQDAVVASVAQQEARANYALLVQRAFAQGFERLIEALADKANAGERIDSALALLRLWAIHTEEVMHETLQSERGLAATAVLTRSALAYRKRTQRLAAVAADLLDIATRRELDDAYREIQELKRELRHLRSVREPAGAAAKRTPASRPHTGEIRKSRSRS